MTSSHRFYPLETKLRKRTMVMCNVQNPIYIGNSCQWGTSGDAVTFTKRRQYEDLAQTLAAHFEDLAHQTNRKPQPLEPSKPRTF